MTVQHPPALAGVPLLGNGPAFLRDAMGTLWRGHREHGPAFTLRLGPKRAAVITGPAESQAVLGFSESILSLRPVYKWLIPMFGEVLQAARVEEYTEQRAMLLPAFRAPNLPNYTAAMVAEAIEWAAELGGRGRFEATSDLERLSMRIAIRAFLGREFRDRAFDRFYELYRDIAGGMEILLPPRLPLPRMLRRDLAKRRIFALMRPAIVASRFAPDPKMFGFLAHFARAKYSDDRPVSDDTLIGLILSLVFAAYETTASQLAWTLAQLLQHPGELARVVDEIDGVVPGDHREITPSVVHKLQRLQWNLREAERLRPITTMLWRYTEQSYTVGAYTVPRGWFTVLCPPITHRSPDLFPDPDSYDPERFSPARDPGGRLATSLLNLGGGTHRCLGGRFAETEMKVVLSVLLSRYRLRLVDPAPQPDKRMGLSRPAAPCHVDYVSRDVPP